MYYREVYNFNIFLQARARGRNDYAIFSFKNSHILFIIQFREISIRLNITFFSTINTYIYDITYYIEVNKAVN